MKRYEYRTELLTGGVPQLDALGAEGWHLCAVTPTPPSNPIGPAPFVGYSGPMGNHGAYSIREGLIGIFARLLPAQEGG
jgi:hypothetical protein